MKRNLLSFLMLLSLMFVNGQTNLINDSKFDEADLQRVYSQTFPNVWYNVWTQHVHSTQTSSSILLQTDATRGNVGAMINGAQNIANAYAWRAFIAQRIQTTAEAGLYKISFWGKSTEGTPTARIFSITGERNASNQYKYFIFDTDKPTESTGKYWAFCKNIPLTSDWVYHEYVFDFSKTTDQLASIEYGSALTATTEDLTNFSICLQNNAANSTMRIDEISLTKHVPSSLRTTSVEDLELYVEGKNIYAANVEGLVSIFDTQGRLIQSTMTQQKQTIKMTVRERGIYIVKNGNQTRRVMIK